MKIRSLTILTTLLFSHLAFADLTVSHPLQLAADPCSNLTGQWDGQGQGQDKSGAVKCIYGGTVTVKQDGPGSFIITDSIVNKISGHLICPRQIPLKELKGTCVKGVISAQGETQGKTEITLNGAFQSDTSVTLDGTMKLEGGMTAQITQFVLNKR